MIKNPKKQRPETIKSKICKAIQTMPRRPADVFHNQFHQKLNRKLIVHTAFVGASGEHIVWMYERTWGCYPATVAITDASGDQLRWHNGEWLLEEIQSGRLSWVSVDSGNPCYRASDSVEDL